MLKVIHPFNDLQDNEHRYNVDDVFPREGASVTDERIAELASNMNKQGRPLIKAEKTKPKKVIE